MRPSASLAGAALLGLIALAGACADSQPRSASWGQDIDLVRELDIVKAQVPRNATFESLLRDQHISNELVVSIVDAVRTVFNPRLLRAERSYSLTRSLDGLFREFHYEIDTDRVLRVVMRNATGVGSPVISASVETLPKTLSTHVVDAVISREQPSLIEALNAEGESILLALKLADALSGEVDFNSELQPDDRFTLLFDRAAVDGRPVGYGEVRAALVTLGGREVQAFRYVGTDGKAGYYDAEGRSLKRQFLKSPLPFDPRVTSGFSMRRLHPVHGTVRPHLGVDYGAPTGTRVQAVAAGVVEFAAWSGEAGRMVRIKHAGGYQTAYLHLSGFGPGIRPGARVSQGDLIGFVGATGTATAPHLDYRIIRNGVYVNPLTELSKMPPGDPIDAAERPAFLVERDAALVRLRQSGSRP